MTSWATAALKARRGMQARIGNQILRQRHRFGPDGRLDAAAREHRPGEALPIWATGDYPSRL